MYPYQLEAQLRNDYQKGRPIVLDQIDRWATNLAKLEERALQELISFRSAFNPTQRGSKFK